MKSTSYDGHYYVCGGWCGAGYFCMIISAGLGLDCDSILMVNG